ncbi:MAG: sigma-54-dependent Fis family transcriptional regulator [Desulfuromonadales bacterium]|nr:sigma-54-dependent Fis family transcriptional regulator [Desulfuromonadales bacterium]
MDKCPVQSLPVLLVDDDETSCSMMALTLREAGVRNVICINDSRQALPFLLEQGAALVLLDLVMPHLSGHELLGHIRRDYPGIQVVVISAANELNQAVECMKQGALDYLSKPVEANRLISCVLNALRMNALQGELRSLKKYLLEDSLDNPAAFEEIRTRNSKMRGLFQYVEVIACSPQPVMITGETGVGKELMARAVHRLSGVSGEFVSVNVAGLDDATFTDTLFGHKKGAFTGADSQRAGLVSQAAGGTLFLDEIGDLDDRSQIKLLRLLQEYEYYPIGSDIIQKSSARVVVATNQNLSERISAKLFRRDLYYRLCIHHIHIPPLRERPEDIPLLLDQFLHEAAQDYQKSPPAVAVSAVSHLLGWSFPGNVRELKAMVFDAVARHTEGALTAQSFGAQREEMPEVASRESTNTTGEYTIEMFFGHFPTFHEIEEYLIDEALRSSAGNINLAATMLGITRQTISNRLKSRRAPTAECKRPASPAVPNLPYV